MNEIEVKYLVDTEKWAKVDKPEPHRIVQGFLFRSKELVIRIRIKDNRAFLTIKGPTRGITRSEYEYEIPIIEAKEMMDQFIEKFIDKFRYEINVNGKLWEVDEFQGKLNGLVLAELELKSEDEAFELPDWVGADVSLDPTYFNSNLIEKV